MKTTKLHHQLSHFGKSNLVRSRLCKEEPGNSKLCPSGRRRLYGTEDREQYKRTILSDRLEIYFGRFNI
jgi:hypothetical protein